MKKARKSVGNTTKIFLTLTSNNSGKIAKKRWDIYPSTKFYKKKTTVFVWG